MRSADPRLPRRLRLFLALWPDEAVRRNVDEHLRGWTLPAGSLRYGPDDWHVTLHFLGSVAMQRAREIADGLAVPVESFELVLDQPRLWPRGLAVVGASKVPAALTSLQARLGDALRRMEHPVEDRPYRPHVTLARRAEAAARPRAPLPIVWPASRFVLVLSTGNTHSRYEVLREYA